MFMQGLEDLKIFKTENKIRRFLHGIIPYNFTAVCKKHKHTHFLVI